MRKEIQICDCCENSDVTLRFIDVPTGRSIDAAGDSDTDIIRFEVCHNCVTKVLNEVCQAAYIHKNNNQIINPNYIINTFNQIKNSNKVEYY